MDAGSDTGIRPPEDPMNNKRVLLPLPILLAAALACNLEQQAAPTLSQAQIETLSAQTIMAIQWQTLSAGGNTPGAPPAGTSAIPAVADTNTMLPTVTSTGTPPPSATFTPTMTATPIPCNWAQFITDVTVPDNWETGPLDHFTKTWRLKNVGSCTWTSGYSLIFDHGDPMSAPASQQLTTGTVAPGGTIDVSVDLLSPAAVGTYQGYFKLRSSDGVPFGIGPSADGAFWVKIKVVTPPLVVEQVEAQVTIAPGAAGNATANCPAGSVVVGGGFDGDGNMSAYNHGMVGNGWKVYAKNYSASNKTLKAYAFCLTGISGSTNQRSHDETISGGSNGNSISGCTAGSVLTGLGFASNPDAMYVHRSDMVANSARATGWNLSGSNQIMRTYAVCLTAAGATTVQATNSTTVAAHSTAALEAACPAGTVATGAGFNIIQPLNMVGLSKKPGSETIVAKVLNLSGSNLDFNAYAVCLAVS
jgi:hypothetical protein